jgi:hypothetical protein
MDFTDTAGFIDRVHSSCARVLRFLPITMVLLLVAGCETTQTGSTPTKVATLQVQPETGTAVTTPAGKEIPCRIQMIDGVEARGSDSLKTGHHRVIVAFGSGENEHVGDVDLLIPAAKNYRLKAERNAEMFTLSLIETDTGKVAAQAVAMVDQVMKFKVFVGQK